MYIGVDVGGTKTLAAVLDEQGTIIEQAKFPTPDNYADFVTQLRQTLADFSHHDFRAGAVALPVTVFDRQHGVAVSFGNLSWHDVPAQHDMEQLCGCPITIENDAKLGGLSEAMLLKDRYRKVLYLTVSTGIGVALINDGVIDTNIGDGGGRAILLEHDGHLEPWEDFAGGRAIVKRYGRKAMDITDEATWQKICRDLAQGIIELIAITEPDVIVIGGSVGTYFDRYGQLLSEALERYHLPLVPIPPIIGAQRAEQAVVYGCYDLAKQTLGAGHAVKA